MNKDEGTVDQELAVRLALKAGIRLQMESTLGTPIDRIVITMGQLVRFANSIADELAAKQAPQERAILTDVEKLMLARCADELRELGASPLSSEIEKILGRLSAAPVEQAPQVAQPVAGAVDWLGLALELEWQAKSVESGGAERAMKSGAHGLRLMGAALSAQTAPQPTPAAPKSNTQSRADFIEQIVLGVAEIPDRFSPEDQPEMMLVTGEELRGIIESAFEFADERAALSQHTEQDAAIKASKEPTP